MFVEFCVPVYNEEQLLRPNVLKLWRFCCEQNFGFDWRIMIVVNGSSDDSVVIADSLAKEKGPKIAYMSIKKPGKGRAIKERFKRSWADIVVYMDIDLAVSLENIRDLLEPVTKSSSDLVIASRLLPSSTVKRSFSRGASSRMYNIIARWALRDGIRDHQCGFKALTSHVFKNIYSDIRDDDWFFDTELIAMAAYKGYSVKEIPVAWEENRYDKRKSKIRVFREGVKFMIGLLRLRRRFVRQRRKIGKIKDLC